MVIFSLSEDIHFLDTCVARFRKVVCEEGWEVPQAPHLISELFLGDLDALGLFLGSIHKQCVSLVSGVLFHNGTLQYCKNNSRKL